MTQDPTLPRQTRSFIVLVALLQGGLLYLAQKGTAQGWWPFDALGGRVCWYTLVLGVPCAMTLSVVDLRDRRFWQHSAGLLAILAGLGAWAAWNATGAPNLESNAVLLPFGLSTAIALFVALPWLQVRLAQGSWRAAYPDLFEHAWQNALTVLLTLAFTGVCWGILQLWAALFALVDITFFRTLFRESAFIHLATGAIAGFGILIARTQQRTVQITRQLLIAAFKGLLPLLAFIALIFAASLPFTGLAPLWKTRSAASVLLSLVALFVIFINAVFQDGRGPRPYPAWLRRVVEAAVLLMPLYGVLALVAMGLRIGQYGWTSERFWGALAAGIATLYAFGYAWAVLQPRAGWLERIAPVNRALSWGVIAVVLLVNSPLLDPWRLVVGDQVARMLARAPQLHDEDALYLRFQAGRRGYQAVQALRDAPSVRASTEAVATLQRALDRQNRWGNLTVKQEHDARIRTIEALRQHVSLASGSVAPEASWWEALLKGKIEGKDCTLRGSECVVIRRDLDRDGRDDVLLCELDPQGTTTCALQTERAGTWRDAGTLRFWRDERPTAEIRAALRAGDLRVHAQRWPDLSLGAGKPKTISETEEAAAQAYRNAAMAE